VFLGEELKEEVQAEKGARGNEGKHGGILLSHCFRLFPGSRTILLVLFVRLNRSEAAEKDGQQCHDQEGSVG